jgi:redox-sensing transcriptional repressor
LAREVWDIDKRWSVIIAGAGNLGQALVNYRGFKKRGFIIKGIFDNNLLNIGKKLDHLYIYDIEEMEKFIRKKNIMIGVLTVSANSAQEVANKMVKSGIRAVLNFAPTHLILPPEIKLHNVDLSIEFEGLTYHLSM